MPTATAGGARRTLEADQKHCRIFNLIHGHRPDTRSMKHPIDAPSEQSMRFFTPELYLRFNAQDDDVADQADMDWESAIHAYHEHLNGIRDQMPQQVKTLSELCLHDCDLLGWDENIEPDPRFSAGPLPVWSAFSVMSLRRDGDLVSLNYVLWDKIRHHPAPSGWPFFKSHPCWLYDEIDIAQGEHGKFLHRILFSDGTTAQIPFAMVHVHTVAIQPGQRASASSNLS